ncbi:hypothetical protein QF028_002165 [Neobacillus sp. B4I6]
MKIPWNLFQRYRVIYRLYKFILEEPIRFLVFLYNIALLFTNKKHIYILEKK